MTHKPSRPSYRPVRDSDGLVCPQLYITQYVRPSGRCTLVVRSDRQGVNGPSFGRADYYEIALGDPWSEHDDASIDSLDHVVTAVSIWLQEWFGGQGRLPDDGGLWDQRPEG